MAGGLFDSAWLKLGQAVVHADVLKADFERTAVDGDSKPSVRFPIQYDAQRHGFPIVVSEITSLPARASLILGDVVHNLHGSLDHLAWALVMRGRAPNLSPGKLSQVYFPIEFTNRDFRDVIPKKLPGVRPQTSQWFAATSRIPKVNARSPCTV